MLQQSHQHWNLKEMYIKCLKSKHPSRELDISTSTFSNRMYKKEWFASGHLKRDDLKHKQESKTPVKLLNVSPQKWKFDPNTQAYRLDNYSKVLATQRVPFPWKYISAHLANASVKFALDSCIPGDIVSLKAKVLLKTNEQSVSCYTTKTDLKKCDITVADSTGPILITLWEDAIAKVNNNTSSNQLKSSILCSRPILLRSHPLSVSSTIE